MRGQITSRCGGEPDLVIGLRDEEVAVAVARDVVDDQRAHGFQPFIRKRASKPYYALLVEFIREQ